MEVMWCFGDILVLVKRELCTRFEISKAITPFCNTMPYPVPAWLEPISSYNRTMIQSTPPKFCKYYLGRKQTVIVSVIEWPAKSPDLNPIVLLRKQLECTVCYARRNHQVNPSCRRRFRKCRVTFLQNTSTNEQLGLLQREYFLRKSKFEGENYYFK